MMKSIIKSYLLPAAIMCLTCLIIYGAVQQTYRTGANDPQQQMAEDAERALNNGADPRTLVGKNVVEISTSLLPYTIIYDEKGKALANDAVLDGAVPSLPSGIFNYTKNHKEDAISWQPRVGVRSALIIRNVDGQFRGYVAAGRSLRLVEEREGNLVKMTGICLFFSLTSLLVLVFIRQLIFK